MHLEVPAVTAAKQDATALLKHQPHLKSHEALAIVAQQRGYKTWQGFQRNQRRTQHR